MKPFGDQMEISFGVEHEVAFLNKEGKFADFSQTKFDDFDQIIAGLPVYPEDYPQLRIGDAGIKVKRWYIEGFERFLDSEKPVDCVPKGIEIRTTIHSSIENTILELSDSFRLLRDTAISFNYTPVLLSFNPHHKVFKPDPPLNSYEIKRRQGSPEKQTAHIPMLTYGPDLNISVKGFSTEKVIEIGKKFTYYSPFIVPFSFSSPFYGGGLWNGYSVRTFVRTGARPAAMVFIDEPGKIINSSPSLTKRSRVPAETGRIEFKAFDSCGDFSLYSGLFALLKGIVLDQRLPGRSVVPNAALHQISAKEGFMNEAIYSEATGVMSAVKTALQGDPDIRMLEPLEKLLGDRVTPAHKLVEKYSNSASMEQVIENTYEQLEFEISSE